MTDDDILDRLKRADALLAEYEQLVRPVAAELARRKSLVVFGAEGGYDGCLGCWEAGIDTICLHIAGAWRNRPNGPDGPDENSDGALDRAQDFRQQWERRFFAAGITRVSIDGHY